MSIPSNVMIDEEKFPVVAAMSEDELLTFSPNMEPGFSLVEALYGVSEASYNLLSGTSLQLFLSSTEEKFRAYAMMRICNDYSDGKMPGMSGEPLKNFMARLAALRLFELTFTYQFLEAHADDVIPRINADKPLISKLRALGIDGTDQQVADLRVFANFHKGRSEQLADWSDYERQCTEILSSAGYNIEHTSSGNDMGADIVCSKSGLTFVVQCKFHASKIGIKAVQEAATALRIYSGDLAIVVGDAGFTNAAFEAARKNGVLLVNTSQLSNIDVLSH